MLFLHLLTVILTLVIDEAATHKLELAKLAEKDPEFYKYLQENDKELLDFNDEGNDVDMDDEDDDTPDAGGDGDEDDAKAPTLTQDYLRRWQKALLEVCRCTRTFSSITKISHPSSIALYEL